MAHVFSPRFLPRFAHTGWNFRQRRRPFPPRPEIRGHAGIEDKHPVSLVVEALDLGADLGQAGEKAFQDGLGPKKVDVSYADERHGLLLAVSIKTITSGPYGKNLKNRFHDLCPEAIALHLRFPYSVVCALFALPCASNLDITPVRKISTFERARRLLSTISGRQEYTGPGEKLENITMILF